FVTDLFGSSVPAAMAGLLFVRSDQGVGVLGLSFNGPAFSALPVATQLNTNNMIATSIGTVNNATTPPVASGTVVVPPTAPISSTVTPSAALGAVPPVPMNVIEVPSPTAAPVVVGDNVTPATDITGSISPVLTPVTGTAGAVTGSFAT